MNVRSTPLAGALVVETATAIDQRGAFTRCYCERELEKVIGTRRIVQINHSRTREIGAVRGMHYQRPPDAEMKMVRCLAGRVWDVVVDLRAGSPTFLQWHAEELSAGNARMLVIPEGCAHGFQTLEENCALLYLHTAFYAPESEGGVRYDDPRIALAWPLPFTDISSRDRSHPLLTPDFNGIAV